MSPTRTRPERPIARRLPAHPLPRPSVVLFDWHGTLVDTLDAMYRAIEDVLPRLDDLGLVDHLTPEGKSRTVEDEKLVRYIRIFRRLHPRILAERRVSRTDIFEAIFGTDGDAIATAHAAYDASYRKYFGAVIPFQDGVFEYVTALRTLGVRVGVATNRSSEFFGAELANIESGRWLELLDVGVCGDEVPHRKPAPDVIHHALDFLGVRASPEVWYVGDGVADVITARRAGVTSIFYNGARWDDDWFDRMFPDGAYGPVASGPDAVVDDFDGLFDLLESAHVVADDAFHEAVRAARPRERHALRAVPPRIEPDWHPAVADLTRPTVVLFDWHATLVDTLDAMYRAVDDTLPELDKLGLFSRLVKPEESRSLEDRKLVEYVRNFHKLHPKIKTDRKISRTDIFEVLFGNDEEAKRMAHAAFNGHYRNHFGAVQPFEPHVRDVLVALRMLDLKVGVITNRDREFFQVELANVDGTGWADLFDTSVCGDDTTRRKPHPDQVELATKNLGAAISPAIWYVGDSTTDTIAAKAAGITSVFFNGAQWDQPWLSTIFPGTERHPHKPDVVVNDFAEFWALVLACLAHERESQP